MVTLPNGTELTEVTRVSCLDRIYAIKLGSFEYDQEVIASQTNKRADCTGWVSYVWATPNSGPGIYLNAYNTASFFTQKAIKRIDWADLLPGDMVGYCSPSSPGNGGHAAIWMAGQKRPDGLFTVCDHGSGWGPKLRQVKWNGNPDSWMAPTRPLTGEPGLAPWRYVAMKEEEDVNLKDVLSNGKTVEECLVAAYTVQLRTTWMANGTDDDWNDIAKRTAAAVAALPGAGSGLSEEQMRKIVREELDKTKLGGA